MTSPGLFQNRKVFYFMGNYQAPGKSGDSGSSNEFKDLLQV